MPIGKLLLTTSTTTTTITTITTTCFARNIYYRIVIIAVDKRCWCYLRKVYVCMYVCMIGTYYVCVNTTCKSTQIVVHVASSQTLLVLFKKSVCMYVCMIGTYYVCVNTTCKSTQIVVHVASSQWVRTGLCNGTYHPRRVHTYIHYIHTYITYTTIIDFVTGVITKTLLLTLPLHYQWIHYKWWPQNQVYVCMYVW